MRITCVHQGFELYGSDRSFVDTVEALRAHFPAAEIIVVLPRRGPIVAALAASASRIDIAPLWVLRRRDLGRLMTVGLLGFPSAVMRAAARFRASDIVYINTAVVADYTVAARFFPGRAIVHVHEIPEARVLAVLRGLLGWSRADLIFNSNATAAAYGPMPRQATTVIYNGIAGPDHPRPMTYDGNRPLRVLMLGRISRIKGQEVLVAALRLLPVEVRRRLSVRVVGSAFEDAARERLLADTIADAGLAAIVALSRFTPDPSDEFRWADIVAVPSRLPESLGRVAIEASAYGRPPLASAIGGLVEVVEPGRTGWLVPPDDPAALAGVLRTIVERPDDWRAFPAAARARYAALFRKDAVAKSLAGLFAAKLAKVGRGSAAPEAAAVSDRA